MKLRLTYVGLRIFSLLLAVLLWFVMLILGGAGPPPEVLSDTMRTVAEATPLPHLITLLQDPWLGFGWNGTETVILSGYLVAAGLLTAWRLRLD